MNSSEIASQIVDDLVLDMFRIEESPIQSEYLSYGIGKAVANFLSLLTP